MTKAATKVVKQTTVVKYVRVYNNMRCGWGMPAILMYAKKPISGEAPLAPGVISHTQSRVPAGGSVILDKDIFENFLKNKETGVINKGLKKLLDNKSLLIVGNKDTPDPRDYVDAPAKMEPSEEDLAQPETMNVLNSKDITIDVTRRTEEIELPVAQK